jgi:hypothetical protein
VKYEAHITVEPYTGPGMTWGRFVDYLFPHRWRAGMFEHDDVDGIAGKWFMSMASDDRQTITTETRNMVRFLEADHFKVLRWKVEETLFDSKHGDQLEDCR